EKKRPNGFKMTPQMLVVLGWQPALRPARNFLVGWAVLPPLLPLPAQLGEAGEALALEPKIRHARVGSAQLPFGSVPVLKDPAALEIVLAHRAFQRVDGLGDQRITLPQFSEGQMKG